MGALVGAGMSEYRARAFARLVKDGRVIVGVTTETRPERRSVVDILAKHGGDVVGEGE
jgi:hypothetical protein